MNKEMQKHKKRLLADKIGQDRYEHGIKYARYTSDPEKFGVLMALSRLMSNIGTCLCWGYVMSKARREPNADKFKDVYDQCNFIGDIYYTQLAKSFNNPLEPPETKAYKFKNDTVLWQRKG